MNKLYIPGDLVYFGGEKAKVWFSNPSSDDSIYVRVIENGGENRIWNASLKEEISPIPLTPEILEKNGWKKSKINDCAYFYYKDGLFLTYTSKDGKFWFDDFDYSISICVDLHYVHSLHHLLFGLGINSEMEVYVWK